MTEQANRQPDLVSGVDPDGVLATLREARRVRAELHQAAGDADDTDRRRLDEAAADADTAIIESVDALIDHLDAGGRLPRAWSANPAPQPTTSDADLAAMGLICTCGAVTDEGCACATRVWNDHNNDIGDWCPWSGRVVEAADIADGDDACCPARCHASRIEEQR